MLTGVITSNGDQYFARSGLLVIRRFIDSLAERTAEKVVNRCYRRCAGNPLSVRPGPVGRVPPCVKSYGFYMRDPNGYLIEAGQTTMTAGPLLVRVKPQVVLTFPAEPG